MNALKRFLAGAVIGGVVSGVLLAVLVATGEHSFAVYVQRVFAISLGTGLAFLLFFP